MTIDPIIAFQKKHTTKVIFFSIMIVIAIILLVLALVVLNKKVAAVKAARAERVFLMNNFTAITTLSLEKKMADLVLPSLEDALPLDIEVPTTVIPRLKNLAAAQSLKASVTLNQGVVPGGDGFSGISFSLRADGTFRNIVNFLNDLEAGKNTVAVNDWSIIEQGGQVFQLVVAGTVYVRTH